MKLMNKLDNVIRVLDGSQPVDIAGAIAALQSIQDSQKVCRHCGTSTMVHDWTGSGDMNMHCLTCKELSE